MKVNRPTPPACFLEQMYGSRTTFSKNAYELGHLKFFVMPPDDGGLRPDFVISIHNS
jgi:hypothetical protein